LFFETLLFEVVFEVLLWRKNTTEFK
jgi:hypothetical protein